MCRIRGREVYVEARVEIMFWQQLNPLHIELQTKAAKSLIQTEESASRVALEAPKRCMMGEEALGQSVSVARTGIQVLAIRAA